MSFPLVLLQPSVSDESQDQVLDTVKLFPNSTSSVQSRFVLPKQGTILDSNSVLTWHVSWDGFDSTKTVDDQLVLLKNPSGGLPTIRRARFFCGSKLIFVNEDVGGSVYVKMLSHTPDYRVEADDIYHGSQSGYFCTTSGKMELGRDGDISTPSYGIYTRALGKYSDTATSDKSIQCSLKLKDIFSGMKSLQLPIAELDECRLEIDWETDFDEVAYIYRDSGTAITDTTISIQNPTLLLDYLTLPEEDVIALRLGLEQGRTFPFVHTSISEKQLSAIGNVDRTDDVLLALQGKLLMKMYVSHRLNNTDAGGEAYSYQKGCGRTRSQRSASASASTESTKFEYNLFINDLAIHDQPVDSVSQAYSFLELAQQVPPSVMAGTFDRNKTFGDAPTPTDVVSGDYQPSGQTVDASNSGLSATEIKDMVAGTTSYIGFDLSKYDEGSDVVPQSAGYRVGSSAVILRITQHGSATADSPQARPRTVEVFTEEVRALRMMGSAIDVIEM
jgi:hypothetical protein